MTPFVWSQIIAACAFGCGLISYQFRTRRSVLFFMTGLALLYAWHFYLLDRSTPGAIMLLTTVRYVTAIYSQHRFFLYLFLCATLAAFLGTYNGPLSLLALAGAISGTLGSFQGSDRVMRLYFMFGNCCWLMHNLLAFTPVATLMEALFLTSNVVGYRRFYHGRDAA